jgi:hypothetical protein
MISQKPQELELELKRYKQYARQAKIKIAILESENCTISLEKTDVIRKAKMTIAKARQETKNARERAKRLKTKLDKILLSSAKSTSQTSP